MICVACRGDLHVGEEYLECMLDSCGKLYHYLCINKVLDVEERVSWVCPECRSVRKEVRNCDTPVGPVACSQSLNITMRNPAVRLFSASESPMEQKPEQTILHEQISKLTDLLTSAYSSITQYQSALGEYTKKLEVVDARLKNLENRPNSALQCQCQCQCSPATTRSMSLAPAEPQQQLSEDDCGIVQKVPTPKTKRKRKTTKSAFAANTDLGTPVPVAPSNSSSVVLLSSEFPPLPKSQASKSTGVLPEIRDTAENIDGSGCAQEEKSENEWTTVHNRKPKRPAYIRGAAGPSITSLKAVEYRKFIHLWNMESGAADIQNYLQNLCSAGTCTVDELKPKGNYKSFKIGIPAADYEKCLSPGIWPENAKVKPWLFRKPQNPPHQKST